MTVFVSRLRFCDYPQRLSQISNPRLFRDKNDKIVAIVTARCHISVINVTIVSLMESVMKTGVLIATLVGLAASPVLAQQPASPIAPATAKAQESDPAVLLNRAAVLVEQGKYYSARDIYKRVEKMQIDYTLETSDGNWVYPSEIARRGLRELEKRSKTINLASRG